MKSYKVGRDGVILGVYDEVDLVYMISCGKVLGTDDYWTDGMEAWAKISSRPKWIISGATSSSSSEERPRSILKPVETNKILSSLPSTESTSVAPPLPSVKDSPKSKNVSFFYMWWTSSLAVYIIYAVLGYLSYEGYGLGYALGSGIIGAPLLGLIIGAGRYNFAKGLI